MLLLSESDWNRLQSTLRQTRDISWLGALLSFSQNARMRASVWSP